MTTKIILTRHGHVDWISSERFRGRAELALSELGLRQTTALGQRIAKTERPDVIYTSPLSRCVHTGEAIARATHAPAYQLEELYDTDYGQWQGLTKDEVRARWPQELQTWLSAPDMAAIPGGEMLTEVLVRGTRVLQKVQREHQGRTVVLVGHDSINRVLLVHMLGVPLSHYWRIKQEPCCMNEIDMHSGTFTVHRINETGHLANIA